MTEYTVELFHVGGEGVEAELAREEKFNSARRIYRWGVRNTPAGSSCPAIVPACRPGVIARTRCRHEPLLSGRL